VERADVADLYRCRWSIEVFFKELKQTLQLADFLGHNVLLRYCAFLSQWGHSFTRLFALIRSALWQKLELRSLLEAYGTAAGGGRFLGTPQQAYLPGLNRCNGTADCHIAATQPKSLNSLNYQTADFLRKQCGLREPHALVGRQ